MSKPLWKFSDYDLSMMFAFGDDVISIAARFEQARRNRLDFEDMPSVPRVDAPQSDSHKKMKIEVK